MYMALCTYFQPFKLRETFNQQFFLSGKKLDRLIDIYVVPSHFFPNLIPEPQICKTKIGPRKHYIYIF
jgi:hypothetical protein